MKFTFMHGTTQVSLFAYDHIKQHYYRLRTPATSGIEGKYDNTENAQLIYLYNVTTSSI